MYFYFFSTTSSYTLNTAHNIIIGPVPQMKQVPSHPVIEVYSSKPHILDTPHIFSTKQKNDDEYTNSKQTINARRTFQERSQNIC